VIVEKRWKMLTINTQKLGSTCQNKVLAVLKLSLDSLFIGFPMLFWVTLSNGLQKN